MRTALSLLPILIVLGAASVGRAQAIDREMDLPVGAPRELAQKPPSGPPPPGLPTDPVVPPPTIYGHPIPSESSTVVFVIDVSYSMSWDRGPYTAPDGSTQTGDRLDRAKAELTRCVTALPRNFKFDILSFDCSSYAWEPALVPATESNKESAVAWIAQLKPLGATGTGPAVVTALAADRANKLVVLLTDGAPNCGAGDGSGDESCKQAHRVMIDEGNTQRAVINVFGINATGLMKQFCEEVASDNGGSYVDVQ